MQDFIRVAYSGDHEQVERPYRVAMGAKAALWGGITLIALGLLIAAWQLFITGPEPSKNCHHSRSEFRDGQECSSGGVGTGLCQKSRSRFWGREWGSWPG